MEATRKTSIIVGVLFIIATLFFMIGQTIHGSVTDSPDYLSQAHPGRFTVIGGVLSALIAILAIPLIAVYLLPVLRRHSEGLAVGYLVFRSIEAMLLVGASIYTLSFTLLSHAYLEATSAGAAMLEQIGASIQAVSSWTFLLGVGIVFPITALMLNAVLYRARLVPRFISAWGFLAAALLLLGTMLIELELLAGIPESSMEPILTIPIAVNEMVFAVWLIVRGFSPARGEVAGSSAADLALRIAAGSS